ncbi:hypothetical protein DOK67_0001227 [Enterococcus sp. DIV0212c]|nr:hypothetical protein [Enterococcus sp. DIV0212c]
MKKYLISFVVSSIVLLCMPSISLAADSHPMTITGEQVKYNTPYYLKDANENYGGVSFWPYASYDYVFFHKDKYVNGTKIVFEAKDMRDGVIRLGDLVGIKMLNANWPGWNYWTSSNGSLSNTGIYLNNETWVQHELYSDSNTHSLGIGITYNWDHTKVFSQYYIDSSSWLYRDVHVAADGGPDMSNIANRNTPFKVIEAK